MNMITNFDELKKNQGNLHIMHYACTSLSDESPVITSISFKKFLDLEGKGFSGKNEEEMIILLLQYMFKHKNEYFITWNQKHPNFGPRHIIERAKKHNIENAEKIIDNVKFVDLDELLKLNYNKYYYGNKIPSSSTKFKELAKRNDITTHEMVYGKDEIVLFEVEKFKKIQKSVERKTRVFNEILDLVFKNKLKVNQSHFRWVIDHRYHLMTLAALIISIVAVFKP